MAAKRFSLAYAYEFFYNSMIPSGLSSHKTSANVNCLRKSKSLFVDFAAECGGDSEPNGTSRRI